VFWVWTGIHGIDDSRVLEIDINVTSCVYATMHATDS